MPYTKKADKAKQMREYRRRKKAELAAMKAELEMLREKVKTFEAEGQS
jgi:hypothetical protein